ncbi:hypothetical protein BG006_001019 [Podila minutissima]|uniref:BTB domain-containing protein n=1 Tax=Podila minutissima TaxID=64525 RepID=A0A9P5SRK4_9FUNG|nr:hypothetical protein BG006_001019 [Podila minutissima]
MTAPNSCTIDIQVPVLRGTDGRTEASLDSTDTAIIVSDVAVPAGTWECVIQQSFEGGEPALTVVLKWVPNTAGLSDPYEQAKVYQYLAQLTQLRVVQGRDTVMSRHLRRPAMLLRGLQVHVDPTMVHCGGRYDFSIQITHLTQSKQRQTHGCQSTEQYQSAGAYDSHTSQRSPGARYQFDDYHADDPRAKLATFLGRPETADMRLSCMVRPTGNNTPEDHYSVIPVHSCVLKAADTAPARRLLRNNTASSSQNEHTIADLFQNRLLTQGGDLGSERLLSRDSSTLPGTHIPEHPRRPDVVKEIRFEDAVPQAVEAVTHFMYTGEIPTPEPYSHYTVKDLMELAVYFDLPDLQDHCIALALGWGQPWSGAPVMYRQDMENQYAYVSALAELLNKDDQGASNQGQEHQSPLQQQQTFSMDPSFLPVPLLYGISSSRSGGQRQLSQLSPESLLQTLFDWGHRFPRMRRALVQAVCRDHGHMFVHPAGALARYREHPAYSEVLTEMVGEQAWVRG